VFAETGFSRLPVFRENIDTITGVILLKDFHHEVINRGRKPSEIVKPVVFVTKTMKISGLLKTLQKKQSHMAVLVDEFGGTLGIVTIEDIIEELVGEIWDEHDEVVEPFKQNSDGSFTVLGGTKLQDMLECINAELPETVNSATTVANWVMENAGVLPRAGEQFSWYNLEITVSRVQRHRVMEVIVKKSAD
jgi:CBS domain containing-hemolysin-like protein